MGTRTTEPSPTTAGSINPSLDSGFDYLGLHLGQGGHEVEREPARGSAR